MDETARFRAVPDGGGGWRDPQRASVISVHGATANRLLAVSLSGWWRKANAGRIASRCTAWGNTARQSVQRCGRTAKNNSSVRYLAPIVGQAGGNMCHESTKVLNSQQRGSPNKVRRVRRQARLQNPKDP